MPLSTNTVVSKTATFTIDNTDKGKTIGLSGGLFAVQLEADTSRIEADFVAQLVNEDTANGKIIAVNGTKFTLWPGQNMVFWVGSSGATWQHTPHQRWRIPPSLQVHVNGTTGSDTSGDGLTPETAFLTITKAYTTIRDEFDLNYQTLTIRVADGTYTESLDVCGQVVGKHVLRIEGNPSAPSNVVWRAGSGGHCIFATDYGCVMIRGFTFEAAGKVALQATQAGIVDIESPTVFGNADGGSHVVVQDGGFFNVLGPYTISGSAVHHLVAMKNGRVSLGGGETPVTFDRMVNITYFLCVLQGGVVATNGTAVVYNDAERCAGTKFLVSSNGVLSGSGTEFPGTIAGSTATGGQYDGSPGAGSLEMLAHHIEDLRRQSAQLQEAVKAVEKRMAARTRLLVRLGALVAVVGGVIGVLSYLAIYTGLFSQ